MKKKKEGKFINVLKKYWPCLLGLILVASGIGASLYDNQTTWNVPLIFFGVFIIALNRIIIAIKSEKNSILKSIVILAISAFALTWLLQVGSFAQLEFINPDYVRLGLTDISLILYYPIYFSLDVIVFLIVLSGFYYLLAQNKMYQKLTSDLAKAAKGNELLVYYVMAVFIVIIGSFFSETLIVLSILPFLLTILAKMKTDKLTSFAVTFGALFVSLIGIPFGSSGLLAFGKNASIAFGEGLNYRLIIQAVVFILFLVFIFLKATKTKGNKENVVALEDPYLVKNTQAKIKTLPIIIVLSTFLVVLVLGYVGWETNFNVLIFKEFHAWLMEVQLFEGFYLFRELFGSMALELGSWDTLTGIILFVMFTLVIAVLNRSTLEDVKNSYVEGFKIILKPLLLVIATYTMFSIMYLSTFTITFSNWIFKLTDGFNFFTATVLGVITSIFHSDLGFTGFTVGNYITRAFEDNLGLIQTVYSSTYGLAQFFAPTSIFLVLGLSLYNVGYKNWLKFVYKFLIAIFIVLLITFAIIQYAV